MIMILMKHRGLSLLVVCTLALSGCVSPSPAPSDKISVAVGIYPYAYLAQEIGGEHVSVTNLTQPGVEPHDLELTAKQVATIATSDLVIYQTGLQPAVDSAVREADLPHLVEVTTVVPLKDYDPHIWLDPMRMAVVAQAIAQELIGIDPDNEVAYTEGLASLTSTLTSIDTEYTTGLAHCQRMDFITSHAAFSYLADAYGLTQIPISGLSPDAEPSPERITEIHRIAEEKGLTTIFFETLASPALAQAIADDLGLETDVLDPLEGITDQSRGNDYSEVMASNLVALRKANGCS